MADVIAGKLCATYNDPRIANEKAGKDVCRNMDMHAEKHRDEWFLSNGKPAMPRFA
jgi:hypothetical protein